MSMPRSAHPKNSKPTSKLQHVLGNTSLRYTLTACILIALWLVLSYAVYRRFPNNYDAPNFYSEDGSVFAKTLAEQGFWHALTTTFNGYYIWGLYILEQAAFIVNKVFFSNVFTELPRSLALISYGFLGFAALLPTLLLRKYIRFSALVIITLFVLFVPLRGWDYSIIGTIGNLKFVFLYIAFVLLVYRHYMPEGSRKVYAIDAAILACAYTNITVYLLMPFALLRYLPQLKTQHGPIIRRIWQLLQNSVSLQSLVVLAVALVPQLYIVHRDGVPALPGYLDSAYDSRRTIEIFGARSYLYELIYPIYKHFTDILTLLTVGGLGIVSWWAARRYRPVLLFGWIAILLGTLLFVVKRTGVSSLFGGYTVGGPDQFFYAQNMIAGFLAGLVIPELINHLKRSWMRWSAYVLGIVLFVAVFIPIASSYGKNNFMETTVGTIYVDAKQACQKSAPHHPVDIAIYPSTGQLYQDAPYSAVCTPKTLAYEPPTVTFGLEPYNNTYIQSLGVANYVTQTFVSPRNDLDGLLIYFSTFDAKVNTPYQISLMGADCKQSVITIPLKVHSITDNSFFLVKFPMQPKSANRTYCFSVVSKQKVNAAPLALQLSRPDIYPEGLTTINQKTSNQDVVFSLHYKD